MIRSSRAQLRSAEAARMLAWTLLQGGRVGVVEGLAFQERRTAASASLVLQSDVDQPL